MENATIFGAGLAGLIAARMLAQFNPVVMEKQASLPNNHEALLRFRSDAVSEATNIPFRKVNVVKWVKGSGNPIADMANYSRKVSGFLHPRSVIDTAPAERWIAPPDLVSQLARGVNVEYGVDFAQWSHELVRPHGPIISTLPVPLMMDLFKWPDKPDFQYSPGWTAKAQIHPELRSRLNATIYYPDPEVPFYRASVTDHSFIIEGAGEKNLDVSSGSLKPWRDFGLTMDDMGPILVSKRSPYQKIVDLSTHERESVKRFVMWLSREHSIYSLGRFATWRPKLLLDDIVNDVRVIQRLVSGESNYIFNKRKHS
jgi:hypothetical protein